MHWDRWLAIIGLIIGLPGFLLLFGPHFALASMAAMAGVVLLGAAAWVRYRTSLPPYTFKRIVTHLEIADSGGKLATITKTYKIRPNYGHLDILKHRNIAADGQLSEFRWNDKLIDENCIERHLGDYVITVRFGACLPAFKEFPGKLSYKLVDSFCGDPEGLIWVSDFPTRLSILKVSLPQDRPCTSVSGHVYMGGIQKQLNSIQKSNGNKEIELKIRRPKTGAEYEIVWSW